VTWLWVSLEIKISNFLLNVFAAYLLSSDGYDVWMGNVRGSKFSMKHRSLNPQTAEFWKFSFHEIGFYDLPAMINYILGITGKPSLIYVGHNQGTTALLVLLSTRPEYNAKIFHAHMLSPLAFMDYMHPLLTFGIEERLKTSQLAGSYNFFSLIDFTTLIVNTYCGDRSWQTLNFCTDLWFMLFGRNLNQTEIDPRVLLDIPNFVSPTASTRQWNHFLQTGKSGKFQMYDSRGDSMMSGFSVPSEYNLVNVKAPMYFYHAAEDLVVSRLVGFTKSL
jgi:lysosomal acid lipase/cholesteryl ester hydrolase